MMIPVSRPTIKRKEMNRVLSCLVSDKIGPGKLCEELAATFARYLNMAGGICLSDYGTALDIIFELYNLQYSDHAVLSPLSPSLYHDALRLRGIQPLFADVDVESGTMLPSQIEHLLKSNPKLLITYHPLGILEDVKRMTGYGIPVLEDVSHAFGGTLEESRCGSNGDCALLSLAEGNIITAGGGVIVVVREKKMYARLLQLAKQRTHHSFLPDMNAALGLAQFAKLNELITSRRGIADIYARSMMRTRHNILMQKGEADNILFSYPVLLTSAMREVRAYAMKNNIETQPAFTDAIINSDGAVDSCPNAAGLLLRCLLFPLYPMLRKQDIDAVSRVLGSLP